MIQYEDEISWEVSSTITTDSLPLWFLAMDRFFAPYRIIKSKIPTGGGIQ
jgi:hypothetical protein